MKRSYRVLFAFLLLGSLTPPLDATYVPLPELTVELDRAVLDPDFDGEGRTPVLILRNEPLLIRLTLAYAHVSEPSDSTRRASRLLAAPDFVLPSGDWFSHVRLELVSRKGDGERTALAVSEVRRGIAPPEATPAAGPAEFRLKNGQMVSAELALPTLAPGDYLLTAHIEGADGRSVDATPIPLAVRVGTESRGVRLAYLRQQADAATTYEAFRAAVFTIREEFPDEYFMMEQLGRRTLERDEIAAAVTYYRIARENYARKLEQRKKDADFPADLRTAAEQNLEHLSVVERVAEYAIAHIGEVALRAKTIDGRDAFVWVDRARGVTLAPVDVSKPDSWR